MTPQIMKSPLTGRHYIVTRFRSDGSAQTKYDCTDQIKAITAGLVSLEDVEMAISEELAGDGNYWAEAVNGLIARILSRLNHTKEGQV